MESTALPELVICGGSIIAFLLAGFFGIAVAATTMLALAGMIVALDAYGPVTDDAGGIAEWRRCRMTSQIAMRSTRSATPRRP